MRIAHDKDDRFPRHKDDKGGRNNGGGNGGKPALKFDFMPGQISGLAEDMSAGYGGTTDKWRNYLKDVYSPVRVPQFNFGGGNGGGEGNGPGGSNNPAGNGGGDPGQTDGGFDPSRPRKSVMPMPAQSVPMGGFLNVGPAGQRMPPTMGLLGQPQQQQNTQAARGGILPPEIQLLLAQRR